MNNHTLRGLALFFIFALNLAVFGNPVRDVSTVSNSQSNLTAPSPTNANANNEAASTTAPSSRVPSNDVLSPRWSQVDQNTNIALLAFTSTNSVNHAVTMLNDVSGALSYVNYGRVPFYQLVVVPSSDKTAMATRLSGTISTTLPEPMSLILVCSGLAALGIAKRKKLRE